MRIAALATLGLGLLLGLALPRPERPLVGPPRTSIGADASQAGPSRLPAGPAPSAILVRAPSPTLLVLAGVAPTSPPRAPRTPIYLRDRVLRL